LREAELTHSIEPTPYHGRDATAHDGPSARERIAKLQAVTAALVEALLPMDVARVVANQMATVLGAAQVIVALPSADGSHLHVVSSSGLQPETIARYTDFSIDADFPAAAVFRTGRCSWVHSKEELFRMHPAIPVQRDAVIVESAACLPLVVKGETLGVVGFGFAAPHTFDAEERAVAEDLARQAALALERARLYEAERTARTSAEQREREMQMLFHLAETTAEARELSVLYEEALRGVGDVLGVSRSSILLCDEAGIMRFRAWRGLSEGYRRAVDGHSPWPRGATDVQAIWIADAHTDASVASYRDIFSAEGIRALAFIPIIGAGRLLGKFMVYSDTPRTFTSHEEHLATTIASHVAQAVLRLQALEAERAAARRLESLSRITRSLVEAGLDTQKLATAIVTELGKTFEAAASLSLVTDDPAVLRVAASYHPDPGANLMLNDIIPRATIRIGEGFSGGVAQSGQSLLAAIDPGSLAARVSPPFRQLLERFPVYSIVAVPIRFGDKIIGTLQTAATRNVPYTADDLALCEELANRAALALTNARLFDHAENARQSREDVLAVVTHDLRNPLGAILLAAASAMRLELSDKKAPRVRKNLATIHRSAERMSRLLADLVDFATIQSGRLKIEPLSFEPREVVEAVLDMFVALAGERSIHLSSKVESGMKLAHGDKDRLIQALANLMSNAIKVTASEGRVRASVQARNGELVFDIEDTGPGIGPEELPHIFERYWRGQKAGYRGTGLGLTIAKGIVEAHGGRIWAESTVGRGSTFAFSIPYEIS
jgi:signal transduction histidine kinase